MADGMKVISREPWWAYPPKPGQSEKDLVWGYLELLENATFRFNHERPSDQEIADRPGCRIAE